MLAQIGAVPTWTDFMDYSNWVSKDKIKAKIEELNKEMLKENNSLEQFYKLKYCYEVLQELLKEE